MVGVHTLIGIGEAVITALAVMSIVASAPTSSTAPGRASSNATLTIRQGVSA